MATYYYLVMSCPACIAAGKSGGIPRQWYHGDGCGGRLTVGDDAYYECERCEYAEHIAYWSYSCNGHSSYRRVSSSHLASTLSLSAQLVNIGGRQWLLSLLMSLGDY